MFLLQKCFLAVLLVLVSVAVLLYGSLFQKWNNDYVGDSIYYYRKTTSSALGVGDVVDEKTHTSTWFRKWTQQTQQPQPNNQQQQPHYSFFAVIASNHSGIDWFFSQLLATSSAAASDDSKSSICRPPFPATILDPDYEHLQLHEGNEASSSLSSSLRNIRNTITRRRKESNVILPCSFAYIRDELQQAAATAAVRNGTTIATSLLCGDEEEASNTNSNNHHQQRPWQCAWLDRLQQKDAVEIDEARILNLYLDVLRGSAGANDNDDDRSPPLRLPPTCRAGKSVQLPSSCKNLLGLAIYANWLPRYPVQPWHPRLLNLTASAPIDKYIYIHRRNYWERYHDSKHYHINNGNHHPPPPFRRNEKEIWMVDTEAMLSRFGWYEYFDTQGREFVSFQQQADRKKEVLHLDYDECFHHNREACWRTVSDFLNVTTVPTPPPQQRSEKPKSLLDRVGNPDEVREALLANGYGSFLANDFDDDDDSQKDDYRPVYLFLHQPDSLVVRTRQFAGIEMRQYENHDILKQLLRELPDESFVVVGDNRARDVDFNHLYRPLTAFKKTLTELLLDRNDNGPAVVLSTTASCCTRALTNVGLGRLFSSENGHHRTGRTCDARNDDPVGACPWHEDQAQLWQAFMKNLAADRGIRGPSTHSYYLDAGLMAGKAADVLYILELADLQDFEDTTAVFTALMHQSPEMIRLDYDQRLFGTFRPLPNAQTPTECVFMDESANSRNLLAHSRLDPLFLQTAATTDCDAVQQQQSLRFPLWEQGIQLTPLVDHFQRIRDKTGKLSGVDRSFGPEVPYFVDHEGLWSSNAIRNRTTSGTMKWRVLPMEENQKLAYELIMEDKNTSTTAPRWPSLQNALAEGGFPFLGWYGDFKKCNYENYEETDSIPMFTNSAKVGCEHAFPVPSYQQMFDARTDRYQAIFRNSRENYPFESKIRKVVWRGTLSDNNPRKIFESIRWRLCETVFQSGSDVFDVGLTKIPKHNRRAEKNLTKVGGLAPYISPMEDFQKYVAILDVDGNSWSSRFGSLLCFNSVVIKIEPSYVDYFYYDLKPWTHFIPIKDDLSDLFETVAWIMDPSNDGIVQDVIASANQWCAARFVPRQLAHDTVDIWESYVRRLDRADPNWAQQWKARKDKLLFSSNLDFVQL